MSHDGHHDRLDLVSMYLNTTLPRAHGIRLQLGPEHAGTRKGTMMLDPNTCGLDAWGDRTWCTKIAVRGFDVTSTRMRIYDEAGHQRVLHRLASAEFDVETVSLIEYPRAGLWYLVYSVKETGTAVIPLFAAELFERSSAGTIAMRYGVPMREVMGRGDLAEMKAEAETVRRALAELDAQPAARRSVKDEHVRDVRAALAELDAAIVKLET